MHGHWLFKSYDGDGPVITNCSNGVQWIWKVLHDCVINDQGIASEVFGMLSIVLWVIVSTPQMVMNCRNIRGVKGISIFLILQWTLGDTTNLIGSVLTNQLPLQIYLAVYFVFADIVLFSQYLYYQYWKWKRTRSFEHPVGPARMVLCLTGFSLSANTLGIILNKFLPFNSHTGNLFHIRQYNSRQLLAANLTHAQFFRNLTDETGYIIGVVSSLFYIGSRLSQIYKNYKRKSTEGLSILMFLLAVLGNITYGVSILVRSIETSFILHHMPWLIGSLGVVFLDLTLLLQFKWYRERNFDSLANEPLTENEVTQEDPQLDYQEVQIDRNGVIN